MVDKRKKIKKSFFDPRWQIIDYDLYIKNIHKFPDACYPMITTCMSQTKENLGKGLKEGNQIQNILKR